MIQYIQNEIMRRAKHLSYTVSDYAPNSMADLFNSPTLVVWSGASDNTIFDSPDVNYAFRALHDALHLKTGLGFSHAHEVELGRIQASMFDSRLMQELVIAEVALQALYHESTGLFVPDQRAFTTKHLNEVKVL